MISAVDCAVLSEDVYNRENNQLANSHDWQRLDAQNWQGGFAAGTYERRGQRVIAFRGTDDVDDALSDARMIPNASPERVASVTPMVLSEYGLSDRTELQVGAVLLSHLLTRPSMRSVIALFANQTPPEQTRQALDYVRRQTSSPVFFTGHSLGGALAKVLSLRLGINCVAFNSPFMGDLRGVAPMSSELITSINARSDPLSLATRQVGNLAHGRVIVVDTPSPSRNPPAVPVVESYRRPDVCPRATGAWWTSEEGIYAAMFGPVCEAVMDTLEPVGSLASAPQRNLIYWFQQRPTYIAALLTYLGDVAIHYHSMENLRRTMENMPRFSTTLPIH